MATTRRYFVRYGSPEKTGWVEIDNNTLDQGARQILKQRAYDGFDLTRNHPGSEGPPPLLPALTADALRRWAQKARLAQSAKTAAKLLQSKNTKLKAVK